MILNKIEAFVWGDTVAAQRELERIRGRKAALTSEQNALTEEIQTIEASAGSELLDATDASTLSRLGKRILQVRTERDLIGRAIALAETREGETLLAVKRAEIAGLRAEAAAKRRAISELEMKVAPLLRQLSELEGVAFTRAALQAQPASGFSTVSGIPLDLCHPGELIPDVDFAFGLTKSRKLLGEAIALEAQARDLEVRLEASLRTEAAFVPGRSPGWHLAAELKPVAD
jgi:hypothetical protein